MVRIAGQSVGGLLLWLALSPSIAVGDNTLANKLHVILVTDTAADIGSFCAENRDLLLQVLKEAFESNESEFQNRYRVTLIQEKDVAPGKILGKIEELEVDPEDALLFYYIGHGAMDDTKGHFLATSGGDLRRSELRAALLAKLPRMLAIVTDSCSSRAEFTPRPRQTPAKWRVIRDLFFVQTGLTDIQSSGEGVLSWCGVFTPAFAANLCMSLEVLDRNQDGFIAWDEFFTGVHDETLANFTRARDGSGPAARIRNVTPQEPHAFNLPTKPLAPDAVLVLARMNRPRYFTDLAVSADGSKLLTGDSDGRLRLWDPTTAREIRTFEKPCQHVWSIALSPDGRYALSHDLFYRGNIPPTTGDNKSAEMPTRVWDVETGKELRRITPLSDGWGAGFLDPERVVLVDRNTLTVWNWHRSLSEATFPISGEGEHPILPGVLENGKRIRLVAANPLNGKCWLHTIAVETERETFHEFPLQLRPFNTALSSDGTLAAIATAARVGNAGSSAPGRCISQVELWDCEKFQRVKVIRDLRQNSSTSGPQMAFSANRRFLAVACAAETDEYGDMTWADYPLTTDLQVWDLLKSKQVLRIGDLPPQLFLVRIPRRLAFLGDRSVAITYGSEVRVYTIPTE